MSVEIIPQLHQMSISESHWSVISETEETAHENGNSDSGATSSQTSCATSVAGSSNSSFSSISGPEMSLPKSIVKKRRVGLDIDDSYGQVTLEDDASDGGITDNETDDYAKFQARQISFIDLGEFDADDESSDEEYDEDYNEVSDDYSDEEDSDGDSIADSYEELDNKCYPNLSYISFTESVSFSMTLSYAEPPVFDDSDSDSDSDSEDDLEDTMTLHEKMVLSLAKGQSFAPSLCGNASLGKPEEHDHDDLDVDKRLLAAYINGIRSANESYKKDLASLALNINQGLSTTPFICTDLVDVDGLYLNHALKHVIGIFRNLVAADELEALLDDAVCNDNTFKSCLGDDSCPTEPTTEKSSLHEDVSQLLSERLIDETMVVEEDVLDFFTRGVIYSLKEWAFENQ